METLTLTADPSGALAFDTTELTAAAGEVTIELVNDSGVPHNVEVEGNGVEEESDTITSGSTDLTVDLEPGEYEFYCAVDGHKDAGMEGTLTVNWRSGETDGCAAGVRCSPRGRRPRSRP